MVLIGMRRGEVSTHALDRRFTIKLGIDVQLSSSLTAFVFTTYRPWYSKDVRM